MVEFFAEYGLYLAKVVTIVVAILVVVGSVVAMGMKNKRAGKGQIEVKHLNEEVEDLKNALRCVVLDKSALKEIEAKDKKQLKAEEKEKKRVAKEKAKAEKRAIKAHGQSHPVNDELDPVDKEDRKKRVYVLNFHGDIKASAVASLKEEITTVLSMATEQDEVVVKLESGGGMVHSYGLASSQLERIKKKKIPLTICVDKVAASGGYMMACIADKIIAAPFAILGSIGVIAQIPNFHKILKKNDIDFEMLTAGEYKRTLTMFGENTDKGRKKFVEDLEDTHGLFKSFVSEQRPVIDIDQVATGEVWFGKRALEVNLVDELKTSDEVIVEACESADVYEVEYVEKKTLHEKLGMAAQVTIDNLLLSWWDRIQNIRFYS